MSERNYLADPENNTTRNISFLQALFKRAVDKLSGNIGGIDIEHKRIHSGDSFAAVKNRTLPTGQSAWFAVTTGNIPVHIPQREIEIDASTVRVTLFENAVPTVGDSVPIYALNRVNIKDPGLSLNDASSADISGAVELLPYTIQAAEGVGGRRIPFATTSKFE